MNHIIPSDIQYNLIKSGPVISTFDKTKLNQTTPSDIYIR